MTQDQRPSAAPTIGVVAIGRNEGERLIACLRSAAAPGRRLVYVDSGSTDGSIEAARNLGAEIVALDLGKPFTAARARNAGAAQLFETGAPPDFIQFVDGDCEIAGGWIEKAAEFLTDAPDCAAVCGRRRERYPRASIYNAVLDDEWATPIGEALACGGDALVRSEAFCQAGGYNPRLIAGEEPEFCLRLRTAGWKIHRIDAEMTLHDAAIGRFGQWWRRSARAGHAFAEVSALHRQSPQRIWARETRRALLWTSLAPLALAAALAHPAALALLAAYPAQVARIAMRGGARNQRWRRAALITIGKFAETQGIFKYYWGRLSGEKAAIIEYRL